MQFYQAVIDNLIERLPDSELVVLLKPLDKLFWPKQRDSLILFGEKDLAKLMGQSSREAISEYKLQGDSHRKTQDF